MNDIFITTLFNVLRLIAGLLILIGCVIYFDRERSLDAVLLLVGQLITVFVAIVWTALIFFMRSTIFGPGTFAICSKASQVVSVIGMWVFAFGFLVMAINLRAPRET